MFCTNCGKKLQDEMKFCPYCGAPVLPPAVPKEEPVVGEPVVEEPEAEEFVEEAVVEEPVIEEPAAAGPAVEEPVSAEPPIEEPTAEEPVISEPVIAEEPAAAEPALEEPTAEEPVISEPVIAEPIAEETVIEEPDVPEPAAGELSEEPISFETAAEEPIAEPAVEEPVVAEPAVEEPVIAEAASATPIITEPAAEEPPKKKKTGLIAAIVAVLVIAAGVGGYFIYQNLPSTKLAKLKTQINTAIENKEVEAAIPLIEQAYEYAPNDEELRKQYVDCSETILLKLFSDEKWEDFIAGSDKLIKDYPEAAEFLDPMVEMSYLKLSDIAIDSGSIPSMQAMKDRLTDLTNSGRFNFKDEINWIEDNIQYVELTNTFQALADKLMPLIKAGDRDAVFEMIRNELVSGSGSARKLAASAADAQYYFPLLSAPDETGKRMGIYYGNGHYLFYYGDYSGDKREGNGIWICADNMKTSNAYREYWAEGPWTNDKPNGTFTINMLSKYANADNEQLIEATAEVTDGLYNGKVTYSYDGSIPVSGTYDNGIPQVIMTTDPNGKEANVIMMSEDGSAWVSRANISDKQGIYGYY